ncbi:MAG: hypothetical protein KJ884_16700 [Gammaproteobacteria bacterium]|nr:hypothetical protein [Gammaproteobacteria bacterium]MBU1490868.1 hypothetical protein [Gammaproteobacteria bacterium]MBU2067554.1 hypothetical protein [Gammaproteobacteria bacterium]MBU2139636.1 hypothetical protein [Gammaproteobacteria bacterium]MBU2215251.1 hypothetical protein [Gammaproteobacteria bacterium]
MSDLEKVSRRKIEDIAFDDMVQFLEAVTPDRACLYCGCDKFELNSKAGDPETVQLVSYPVYGQKNKIYPVVIMGCQKCGGVYTHRYSIVKEWIDTNLRGPEDDVAHSLEEPV